MWRYLAAAFLFRSDVPGLGAVPLNVVAVIAFLILGFGIPAFWLLGFGLEVAYLFTLASNPRFQRLVDSRRGAEERSLAAADARGAVESLAPEARRRAGIVEEKLRKVLRLYDEAQADPFVVESNRTALEKLVGSYAELLKAQQTLRSLDDTRATAVRIRGEIAKLEGEVAADVTLSAAARDAKTATLDLLHKRLENLEPRGETLGEIESHLTRIETQMDLALDSAALRGRQEAISADIDVASFLLDDRLYADVASDRGDTPAERRPRAPERQ
jgi:hypothetical protein